VDLGTNPEKAVGIQPASEPVMIIVSGERRSLLIEDAAVLLGVSRRTVYYRIREGTLETVRTIGGSQRVLLASIERLLRQQRVTAAVVSVDLIEDPRS
jgi:excisionase family DNA binding protein